MSDERYTAEAFLRAIGVKHIGFPASWNCRQMFSEECDTVTDSITLGLGLEWLRGQDRYGHMEAKIRVALGTQMGNACMEAFQWLLVRCPRPGAALAKAIIDAQGDGE